MMRHRGLAALVLTAVIAIGGASAAHSGQRPGPDLVVFAASSLKTALDDVALAWREASGGTLRLSFAGSSRLAWQIQQGAPVDIFISANTKWMDVLERDGSILARSRTDLLGNRLVLIAHGKGAKPVDLSGGDNLAALLAGGRLAMAMVDSVPAGIYGKAALESLGWWKAVAPHVAQTDNVRSALALVARGEAPFGIVYATDAAASDNVTVVAAFPQETHEPIIYPGAVVTESAEAAAAQRFLDYLAAPRMAAIFERHGFIVLPRRGDG